MSTWLDSLSENLNPDILEQARQVEQQGIDPADFLLKGEHLTSNAVLSSLSDFYTIPAMTLGHYEPDERAISKVSEEVARRFRLMPLFISRDKFYIATSKPGNLFCSDYMSTLTTMTIEEVVTTDENIEQAINRYYLAGDRTREKVKTIVSLKEEKPAEEIQEITLDDQDAPSIRLVNHIVSSAIRLGASDIHIEPFEDSVLLRYRLDGILREYPPPPLDMIKAITSRIKIISNLDVAERRLPQDGRTSFEIDGKEYDLRVSIIPNLFGESIVIRILASSAEVKDLKNLGFSPKMLRDYSRMITKPYGVVLVTGPTGSGKSTTLYATLRHILSPEKKIITLEDPVEAKIKGITQFQIQAPIGFTFARALRSVLRHDPEVVLVGEIRDQETAETAIRASLTGHMLFSTLHTNDAPSAPTRLIDMGVPGYLVMTSLIGVLAQRLVRRLCPQCKEPFQPEQSHLATVGITELPHGATPYRPVGCGNCQQLGYKGRIALYELLEVTSEMRRLPEKEMTSDRLRDCAESQGFFSLRQSGIEKWLSGVTSLEEVIKLTVE